LFGERMIRVALGRAFRARSTPTLIAFGVVGTALGVFGRPEIPHSVLVELVALPDKPR
jgi:hypothetical protein